MTETRLPFDIEEYVRCRELMFSAQRALRDVAHSPAAESPDVMAIITAALNDATFGFAEFSNAVIAHHRAEKRAAKS